VVNTTRREEELLVLSRLETRYMSLLGAQLDGNLGRKNTITVNEKKVKAIMSQLDR
jgi:hypothetical protein